MFLADVNKISNLNNDEFFNMCSPFLCYKVLKKRNKIHFVNKISNLNNDGFFIYIFHDILYVLYKKILMQFLFIHSVLLHWQF